MEEIKVGEYIRTIDGLIGKLEQINKEPTDETITYIVTDSFEGMIEEIIKHSKNIIDLIEVGDYINGAEVIRVFSNSITIITKYGLQSYTFKEINEKKYGSIIKSIVTKEQFSNIEYRLED